jgi:LysR family transcriptional activator of nhaA
MEWLNYHHLLYFHTAAKKGGIKEAAQALGLTEPTVSKQVKLLEEALGEPLFARRGRRLVPTEMGSVVLDYAEEIFALGQEILDVTRQRPSNRMPQLQVGIAYSVPKLVARELLRPALQQTPPVRLICREGNSAELIDALVHHRIDLIVTDQPPGPQPGRRVFTHTLGSSHVGFYARGHMTRSLKKNFPQSLDGQPALLPSDHSALRLPLDHWFEQRGIRPTVLAEFDDPAMLKVFAQTGLGYFPAPLVVDEEIASIYGVKRLGMAEGLKETYHAITLERRITHPLLKELLQDWRGIF